MDLEYATWLTDNQVPFCIVFTKTDKRKKGAPDNQTNIMQFKRELLKVCKRIWLRAGIAWRCPAHLDYATGALFCCRLCLCTQDFEFLPPSIATSSENGTGKQQLLHFIGGLRVLKEQGGMR